MRWRRWTLGSLVLFAVAAWLWLALYPDGDDGRHAKPPPAGAIALGVIGDSGAHSYQDTLAFPPGAPERGGALRPRTFLWNEVLARLRGNELDPGPWVEWGRPPMVSWARELLGMEGGRAPAKRDYLYNFARSGSSCTNLMGVGLRQRFRQVPRLVDMMDRDPARWRNGVVVIRIGTIDWVMLGDLPSEKPDAPEVDAVIDYCTRQLASSIEHIHASHPGVKVLVVGIVEDTADTDYIKTLRTVPARARMQQAIARFNDSLRKLVKDEPNAAFFDDSAWSGSHWGAQASPDDLDPQTTIEIGGRLKVSNTRGDDPHNALLADDHGGLAWNALWAQALLARMREAFDLPLTPISDAEVAAFVLPLAEGRQ